MLQSKITVGLVGNPNCGKTTLFNALTGARQRVGNWPGVTVERKQGQVTGAHGKITCVDLPGVYSLTQAAGESALDEQIACDYLLGGQAQLMINVVDASHLERNLYLTIQLLEMNIPVVLALNMMDVLERRGVHIDLPALSSALGCPVVPICSTKKKGLDALLEAVVQQEQSPTRRVKQKMFSPAVQKAASYCTEALMAFYPNKPEQNVWASLRLLEQDSYVSGLLGEQVMEALQEPLAKAQDETDEDFDILIAGQRYDFIHELVAKVATRAGDVPTNMTNRLDKLILHRVLGIPFFFFVMYAMFVFAINIGGAFQDFFDLGSQAIFVQGLGTALLHMGLPHWLVAIISQGAGKGVNTTVTFIPVIGAMFLFLSFLEDSGYMARAAFVMDRFMKFLGLPGKSFVPMIVGFGCNVPAVMAARTLENSRDRILTVMMSPFMSCGARLAIFAVFTAAFFPEGGQDVVFVLYIIGILMAVLTGLILRKTLLKGEPAPFILELPPYHLPTITSLLFHTWSRLKRFLFKAGRIIVPLCLVIGTLNAVSVHGKLIQGHGSQDSLLSSVGRTVTPIFHPMGITDDNWPATVGLLTGVLAKEVVVATLNTLYSETGDLTVDAEAPTSVWDNLRAAVATIPANLKDLKSAFANPVLASESDYQVTKGVYGQMVSRFSGKASAFAYLLFVLLYIPCISTVAATWRELTPGWAGFSLLWNTGVAYGVSVGFYQLATLEAHLGQSLAWVSVIALFFVACLLSMRWVGKHPLDKAATCY